MLKYALVLATSAVFALIATPAVRRIAICVGAIDLPGGRRIHAQPTPRFGGLAVYVAFLLALILGCEIDPYISNSVWGADQGLAAVVLAATGIMAVGLIDDRRPVRPLIKLSAEIAAALVVVAAGWRIGSALHLNLGWFGAVATVVWIVAVVNAVNMIDGLDGLAAGVCLIISATLFSVSLYLRQVNSAIVLVALTGALFGFLCYNFHPARIFLGDSGSLLIGFILAVSAIESSSKAATAVAIIAPLLALGLPLAELVLTVLRRSLRTISVVPPDSRAERYQFSVHSRPTLFVADRDHIHHRLLALGITYRRAVVLLYAACAVLGGAAFVLVCFNGFDLALLLAAFFVAAIAAVRRLGYKELQLFKSGLLLPFFDLSANRRIVYILFDLGFILVSYFAAYAICRHGTAWRTGSGPFVVELPAVAMVQVSCFLLSGLYRRSYRYIGIADVPAILKALVFAAVAGWGVRLAVAGWRTPPLDLTVVDAYLLATMVIGSRLSFRLLDYFFSSSRDGSRRVIIYGAGSGGVTTLREVRSNPALGMTAVGFLDDDARRLGSIVHGLPVFAPNALRELIETKKIEEVLVSTEKISGENLDAVLRCCNDAGVSLRTCRIVLSEIRKPAKEEAHAASVLAPAERGFAAPREAT